MSGSDIHYSLTPLIFNQDINAASEISGPTTFKTILQVYSNWKHMLNQLKK